MSRQEDASEVRKAIQAPLRDNVFVVILTGTSYANLDQQVAAAIRGRHKR